MAQAPGVMGIAIPPEISFARRVIHRYSLEPPVDVESVIQQYAQLSYMDIPIDDADGISINLKVRGKMPKVIVNARHALLRQRFTLAHELGHIIIPWHIGTIVDHADPAQTESNTNYLKVEREANAFAAELLMPEDWIQPLMQIQPNPAKLHRIVSRKCQTSMLASAIRIAQFLPKNFAYASVIGGKVEFSGRSTGTLANLLTWESEFPENAYDYSEKHYVEQLDSRQLHWWQLPDKVTVRRTDPRTWRKILSDILRDLRTPPAQLEKRMASINAVIAFANGSAKKWGDYSVETVISACIQRFEGKKEFEKLVKHDDFTLLIFKKARELVHGK